MRVAVIPAVMTHSLSLLAPLALLALVCAAAPQLARAQSTPEAQASEVETEARARFQLGQLYYSQARFAEAAAEFEASYAAHPHPLLLHNLYLARRDLGDLPGAIDALSRYLAAATDLTAADRRVLDGRLQTMQRQLETAPPQPPEPAPDPVAEPVSVPPPVEEQPLVSTESAPAAATSAGLGLAPGAIVLGLGGALLIGAGIAGGVAEGVRSERDGMCTLADGSCPASVDQAGYVSRFASARDTGWGLFIAGAATAALGGVLLAIGATQPSSSPSVSAACDGQGCVAALSGSF